MGAHRWPGDAAALPPVRLTTRGAVVSLLVPWLLLVVWSWVLLQQQQPEPTCTTGTEWLSVPVQTSTTVDARPPVLLPDVTPPPAKAGQDRRPVDEQPPTRQP